MITHAQLEHTLPLPGQRFRCNKVRVFSRPMQSLEDPLGDGPAQASLISFSLRRKADLIHFTSSGPTSLRHPVPV